MVTVTIDTDIVVGHKFGRFDLVDLATKKSLDIAVVSVTERELKNKITDIIEIQRINETMVWDESPWGSEWGGTIPEVAVLGESVIGNCIIAGDSHVDAFETILKIISNGGFPKVGERETLSLGQKHQLRDAMILEAHVRKKRDYFVSNDKRAFIGKSNGDKRQQLETQFATRILTMDEFLSHLNQS